MSSFLSKMRRIVCLMSQCCLYCGAGGFLRILTPPLHKKVLWNTLGLSLYFWSKLCGFNKMILNGDICEWQNLQVIASQGWDFQVLGPNDQILESAPDSGPRKIRMIFIQLIPSHEAGLFSVGGRKGFWVFFLGVGVCFQIRWFDLCHQQFTGALGALTFLHTPFRN